MSGNMPRLTKKYPIFGAITECDFRGKIKAQKHWCKLHYALLWIFSRKTRLVTVPRFGFSRVFTDNLSGIRVELGILRIIGAKDISVAL